MHNVYYIFLKNSVSAIAPPLCRLFNKSLRVGVCPGRFKEAFLTPIFKDGNKSAVENYRPICILSSFMKWFEKLMHKYLFAYFSRRIDTNQHGFFKRRSITTNLALATQSFARSLDNGTEIHCIYTDFSKAFDRISIPLLLKKIRKYGVSDSLHSWLARYLTERKLYVAFNNHRLFSFIPQSGVPQGSILGPLLFLVYINDLGIEFDSNYQFYANDLKIYKEIKSPDDIASLQGDLNKLAPLVYI